MPDDSKIFHHIQKAREQLYQAEREVKGKDEIYLSASQHKLSKRFISECKKFSEYLNKIFNP